MSDHEPETVREPYPLLGTGFKPDAHIRPEDLFPGHTAQTVLGATPETFPDVIVNSDLLPVTGGIRNQKTCEGCVGFTFAEVFTYLFAGLGITKIFSAYFFYWLGRAVGLKLEGLPNTTPLDDAGTEPSLVVQGALAGAALEEVMPSDDPDRVNDPERSAAASDASSRVALCIKAFVAVAAANDNDTEALVLQGLMPRADGTRGRLVMGAVDASVLQGNDGSVVVEPSGQSVNHMIEMLDAVKVVSFDPSTMRGLLANGLILTFKVAPVVGSYVERWQNHWDVTAHAKCDIPGTFWGSRAFMLAAQFKYIVAVDEAAVRASA